jgi:hypothetical protein
MFCSTQTYYLEPISYALTPYKQQTLAIIKKVEEEEKVGQENKLTT